MPRHASSGTEADHVLFSTNGTGTDIVHLLFLERISRTVLTCAPRTNAPSEAGHVPEHTRSCADKDSETSCKSCKIEGSGPKTGESGCRRENEADSYPGMRHRRSRSGAGVSRHAAAAAGQGEGRFDSKGSKRTPQRRRRTGIGPWAPPDDGLRYRAPARRDTRGPWRQPRGRAEVLSMANENATFLVIENATLQAWARTTGMAGIETIGSAPSLHRPGWRRSRHDPGQPPIGGPWSL